ncbi:MAG TPA: DUF881 domain-containing protein [Desulfitobacteriaceae bacterium]|nr:DUF881 domain-containing protein [Desulfitobacteriaceae bacterium]
MQWHKDVRYLLTLGTFVLGILFILLFKSNGVLGETVTSETALPNLVQTEQENQQLANDNEKLRQELAKYEEGENTAALVDQQLLDAKKNAALTGLSGPGLRITLDDSHRQANVTEDIQYYVIHEAYIRQLINTLWNGGAEAIAVNNQRITSDTEIFCSGSYIQINGTRQMTPYVISAIGDSRNLQSALNFYYLWDMLGDFEEQYGITRKTEVLDNLTVPAGKLRTYHYAEPVKEGQ